MRAPYQILAIPYKIENRVPLYCVLRRGDAGWWQFVAGGGEDDETPMEAAEREIMEEVGISAEAVMPLTSMCYVPADCIAERHRKNWPKDTFVLPEYHFAFECNAEIVLSREHTAYCWVRYDEASALLNWESNKTALYELNCRLKMLQADKM